MHIDRTKYTAHYENGVVVAQWVGVDVAMSDGDDPYDALNYAKEVVGKWQSANATAFPIGSMPPPGPPQVITVERTSENERIAKLIRDIYACTELDGDNGLLTFNKLATTCKEAQQAFDIMFKKLSGHSNRAF
jgi:hypothetical protein